MKRLAPRVQGQLYRRRLHSTAGTGQGALGGLRVGVVGMGALGSLFAAKLASAGCEVWGLVRSDAHREAIRRSGLCLVDARTKVGEEPVHRGHRVNVSVFTNPAEVRGKGMEADVLIFLTKSYDTDRTAAELPFRDLMRSSGVVLTLQNGMGNLEIIQSHLNAQEKRSRSGSIQTPVVMQGITDVGALLDQPGHVTHTGDGSVFLPLHPLMERLSDALQKAGMKASLSEGITTRAWIKLIANAAINPLTALFGVPNGHVLSNPHIQSLASGVVAESVGVARAARIELASFLDLEGNESNQECVWKRVEQQMTEYVYQVARSTAPNRSSMLRDIERGQRTEIDFINGFLVEQGRKASADTTLNTHLCAMIKACEYERRITTL